MLVIPIRGYRSLVLCLLACATFSCSDGDSTDGPQAGTDANDGGQHNAGAGGSGGGGGQAGASGEGGAGGAGGAGGQAGDGGDPEASCGNGELEGDEQCDDGNTTALDGCSPNCGISLGWTCPEEGMSCEATCGDGIALGAEVCDDGNDDDEDYCSNDCSTAGLCGDGTQQSGANEQCDDGNTVTETCAYGEESCTVCTDKCQLFAGIVDYCGDSITNEDEGEDCDEGNAVTEAWDYGAQSCTVCDEDCQEIAGATHECGDGETDAPDEQCDDGNASTESCSYGATSCTVCNLSCQNSPGVTSYCGDAVTDEANGENCDDSNAVTEACDYGETACSVCGSACTMTAGATSYCGDQTTDAEDDEECDDGDSDPLDGCDECMVVAIPECGDSVIEEAVGENCDDGDSDNLDGCNAACRRETGWTCPVVGEDCIETCSDGLTVGDEACDDDNAVDGDYCSNDCTIRRFCGDGDVQAVEGEQCDDDNAVTEACDYGVTSCTVCNASCRQVAGAVSYCGDAVHDGAGGEECDEGGATETCRADCELQRYCILDLQLTGEYQLTSTIGGFGDGTFPQSGGAFKVRLPDNGSGAPGAHPESLNRAGVLYYNMPVMFQKVIHLLAMTITTSVTSIAGGPTNMCPLNQGTLTGTNVSMLACPYRPTAGMTGHCTTDWTPAHQNEIASSAGCLPVTAIGGIHCEGSPEACALGALMVGDNPVNDSWPQPQNTAQFDSSFMTSVMNGLGGPTDCPITDPSRVGSATYTNKLETPERVTSRGWISTAGTRVGMTCNLLPADCDP